MNKENQIRIVKEICETAYSLLIQKLAFGGITAKNEPAFQLELGHILKTLGQLYEFRIEDKFHLDFETYINLNEQSIKSKSDRARIDILIRYQDNDTITKAAIELKFFKEDNNREPNNRYDVFKDLSNLELYKRHDIDICYFILATDHKHYVNQVSYSEKTGDFDFRHDKKYVSKTVLQYKTATPYGPDLVLENDYHFKWKRINELYFLKVEI